MAGQSIIFFGKYSTVANGSDYLSDPFDITPYEQLKVQIYLAGKTGSGTLTAQLQESSDLVTWSNKGSAVSPTAVGMSTIDTSDCARYIRLAITSTFDGVTFWAMGVARES